MNKKIQILLSFIMLCMIWFLPPLTVKSDMDDISVCKKEKTIMLSTGDSVLYEDEIIQNDEMSMSLSNEDIYLIALVTMAEAEGESEYGKRLVIDTILNRMESPDFPDSVHEVIYQPNQFSSVWNGRIEKCKVMEDVCLFVIEEFWDRKSQEVIYFRTGKYSKYGTPLFQEGNHYFSSY